MAKERPSRTPSPPSSPCSSSSSSSSSSSEEEEEVVVAQQNNHSKPDPHETPDQKQGSESESESESDSESEGSSEEDDDDEENLEPVLSTPSAPTSTSTPALALAPAPESKPPEFESEKTEVIGKSILEERSNGSSAIKRTWTFEDEITILEGMAEYQAKNGTIALNTGGVKDFHNLLRKSLVNDVDDRRFADKLRKMRDKYISANRRGDKLKFKTDHDKNVYELSKKVWGLEKPSLVGNSSERATVSGGKREFPFFREAMGGNSQALAMLEMVDEEKAMVYERKFKKLRLAAFDLATKAQMFLYKQTRNFMSMD